MSEPTPLDAFVTDVSALLDGSADAATRARIEQSMLADPALCDLYREMVQVDAILNWRHRRKPLSLTPSDVSTKPDLSPLRAKVRVPAISDFRFPISDWKKPTLIAAALLLAACGVAIYMLVFNLEPETLNPKPASSPIATVVETSGGGTLVINDRIANPGDEIAAGDLSLDTGSADFRLANGVAVTLRGQTRLTVHDSMHATLAVGEATFDCPHTAKGYTVHLPSGARVVDLGTRFHLRIAPDGTRTLAVLAGSVAVHPAAHADAEPAAGEASGTTRIVRAGQTANLDAAGSVASLVLTDSINLLANGSFESAVTASPAAWGEGWALRRDDAPDASPNTLDHWRITGSGKWLFGSAYWKPADGRHALSLHNYPGERLVAEQSADVLPDQPCELRFHLAGRFDARDHPTAQSLRVIVLDGDVPAVDRVLVADRPADFDARTAPGWTAHAIRFTPQSARVTVRFQSAEQSHPYGAVIDAVGLYTTVEPDVVETPPATTENHEMGDAP